MQTFYYKNLRHCVELLGEVGLLVSCVVLVKDAVSNCLVYLLNRELVKIGSCCLVAGLNCKVVLLECGLELALDHLILESLGLVNEDTLLCGLDISHFFLLIISAT